MKATIQTTIRHSMTFLAGVGGILASRGLIDSTDVVAVNGYGVSLADSLSGLAAALVMRGVLFLFGKFSGGDDGKSGGSSGGSLLPLLMMGTAAVCLGLPSCSTVVAPDGTKTTKTDAEAVGLYGSYALQLVERLKPAPRAEPAPERIAIIPGK